MNKTVLVIPLVLITAFVLNDSTTQAENPNDIIVVANKSTPADSISMGELRAIFLKKKSNWPNGLRIVPVHAPYGSRLRKAFLRKVIKMDENVEKAYWQEQIIKHGVRKPPEFSHTQKAVYKLRGSIGYVYGSDYKKGVTKTLLVISVIDK